MPLTIQKYSVDSTEETATFNRNNAEKLKAENLKITAKNAEISEKNVLIEAENARNAPKLEAENAKIKVTFYIVVCELFL